MAFDSLKGRVKGALGLRTERKTFTLTAPVTLALFGVIPSATGLHIRLCIILCTAFGAYLVMLLSR